MGLHLLSGQWSFLLVIFWIVIWSFAILCLRTRLRSCDLLEKSYWLPCFFKFLIFLCCNLCPCWFGYLFLLPFLEWKGLLLKSHPPVLLRHKTNCPWKWFLLSFPSREFPSQSCVQLCSVAVWPFFVSVSVRCPFFACLRFQNSYSLSLFEVSSLFWALSQEVSFASTLLATWLSCYIEINTITMCNQTARGSRRSWQRFLGFLHWVRSLRILPFPKDTPFLNWTSRSISEEGHWTVLLSLHLQTSLRPGVCVWVGGWNVYSSLGKWCHLVSSLESCPPQHAWIFFIIHIFSHNQFLSILYSTPHHVCVLS